MKLDPQIDTAAKIKVQSRSIYDGQNKATNLNLAQTEP
jgi:hypothetical protein